MCEKIKDTSSRKRLEFGAVPLEPWSAPYPDMSGESYTQASLRHIHKRLDANFHIPIENGTIDSKEELEQLYNFCDISLADAHLRRITHHYDNTADKEIHGEPDVVEAVRSGTATPEEMLRTLMYNPHLGAIELAKLTHPFDSHGDDAMMQSVAEALRVHNAEPHAEPARYKIKRINTDIPAMTVLEKQPLAMIEIAGGQLDVMMRKSYLVRMNPAVMAMESQPRIDRIIRNIDEQHAQKRLFTLMGEASQASESVDMTPWLDVLTTSVYAVYRGQ